MKQLLGHDSPATAYVVDDYPYGFRLRCRIRYWVETTKHGQRLVSQTTNPKKPGEVWNKPKASTYNEVELLVLNDNGHVSTVGFHKYTTPEVIAAFAEAYELDEHQTNVAQRWIAAHAAYATRKASGAPVAVAAPEVAQMLDPTGTLQQAGLLKVEKT